MNIDKLSEQDRNEYLTLKLEVNEHKMKIMDEVTELQKDFDNQDHESFKSRN